MAALRVSAYEPLWTAFTTYSLCEALNLAAISLTRSPSTAVIACQNWISVAATDVDGRPARSTVATSTLSVERFMRASIIQSRASAGGAPAPRRPAARTTNLQSRLGRRGPSPATACRAHHEFTVAPRPAGPQPRDGLPRAPRIYSRASAGG